MAWNPLPWLLDTNAHCFLLHVFSLQKMGQNPKTLNLARLSALCTRAPSIFLPTCPHLSSGSSATQTQSPRPLKQSRWRGCAPAPAFSFLAQGMASPHPSFPRGFTEPSPGRRWPRTVSPAASNVLALLVHLTDPNPGILAHARH